MAHSDKNILITPNKGVSTGDPTIEFSGADASLGPQKINLRVYATENGTVSFEGLLGQILSLSNSNDRDMVTICDVAGMPVITIRKDGTLILSKHVARVLIGTDVDDGINKLQVAGSISATNIGGTNYATILKYS